MKKSIIIAIVSIFIVISCNNHYKEDIIFKQFYFSKLDSIISYIKLFDTDEEVPLTSERSRIFYTCTEYFRYLTNHKFRYIEIEHHPCYENQFDAKTDVKSLIKWYRKNKYEMTKERADSIVKARYEQETGYQAIFKSPPLLSIQAIEIVILPYDSTVMVDKKYRQAELRDKDIELSDSILTLCINYYNIEQEKRFQEICSRYPDAKFDKNQFVIDLKEYFRQYICVTNERGEKEVWINFYCAAYFWGKDFSEDIDRYLEKISAWRAGSLIVSDGSNCFFNLKINLTTKKYYDLLVNGEA